MKNKTLCTICVRGGSKGVKGKNLKNLNGKPLLSHTIIQAIESNIFDKVVVSTDSDDLIAIAREYGAEVFFKRSDNLSSDTAGKIDVFKDVLLRSEEYYGKKYDYIVDLDATAPLRLVSDIINSFDQFIKDNNDNLITAMPSRRSPYFNLIEMDENKNVFLSKKPKELLLRRQDSPKCFDMNASIYIWKRDALLVSDDVFLNNTGLYVMPEERSIDIDSELDFKFVEFLMKENNVK